jgi:hypothetical protein
MILYHWTAEKNLFGIAAFGLKPHCYSEELEVMTVGREVVWLGTGDADSNTGRY